MKNTLLRQVHPAHYTNGLSSGAFRPTPSDEDKMSVDCGNMTSAQASYELHLTKSRVLPNGERSYLETVGTWAISRELCIAEKLSVIANPVQAKDGQPANAAHHLVDFASIVGKPTKKNDTVAKRLRKEALERGRLWPQV